MDHGIIAALVAGTFGIVTPLLTWLATTTYQTRFLEVMSSGRRRALAGNWHGAFRQPKDPSGNSVKVPVDLTLKTSRKLVTGTGSCRWTMGNENYEGRFVLRGGFLHERFLRLNYQSTDDSKVQFGAVTLELSADSKALTGRFIGYGPYSERMIHGTVEVEKA